MKNIIGFSHMILLALLIAANISIAQERQIPERQETNFRVLIDDNPVGEKIEIVEIDLVIKSKKSSAEIEFFYRSMNLDLMLIGRKINIELGDSAELKKVFTGKIINHKLEQSPGNEIIMTIECEGTQGEIELSKTPVIKLTRGANIVEFEFELAKGSKLKGEITTPGIQECLIGNQIELGGFGSQIDGEVLVSKVKQIVKEGNWTTKLYVEKTP